MFWRRHLRDDRGEGACEPPGQREELLEYLRDRLRLAVEFATLGAYEVTGEGAIRPVEELPEAASRAAEPAGDRAARLRLIVERPATSHRVQASDRVFAPDRSPCATPASRRRPQQHASSTSRAAAAATRHCRGEGNEGDCRGRRVPGRSEPAAGTARHLSDGRWRAGAVVKPEQPCVWQGS